MCTRWVPARRGRSVRCGERIPGSSGPSVAQGVGVEVGETEAAVDLDIVVEYGVGIAELGRSIQRNVKQSVERMTGLRVVEVNVAVDDVYLPAPTTRTTRRRECHDRRASARAAGSPAPAVIDGIDVEAVAAAVEGAPASPGSTAAGSARSRRICRDARCPG